MVSVRAYLGGRLGSPPLRQLEYFESRQSGASNDNTLQYTVPRKSKGEILESHFIMIGNAVLYAVLLRSLKKQHKEHETWDVGMECQETTLDR